MIESFAVLFLELTKNDEGNADIIYQVHNVVSLNIFSLQTISDLF